MKLNVKKKVALALCIAMIVVSMAGCSGQGNSGTTTASSTTAASSQTTAGGAQGSKGYTVGYNYFGNAGVLVTLGNNIKYGVEAFGGTATGMDDQFTVDKIVQDVENLISKGVDGLVIWSPTDAIYPTISKMCQDAKIPFALDDKVPIDSKIREQLQQNPYFVGGTAPINADYGKAMAEYALSKGWKTCIVNTSMPGDPTDQPRLDAFTKVFEASGGKIVDTVRSSGTDGGEADLENSLVAHPNPDFIYGVGSSFGIGAAKALTKYKFNTKVITSGLESEVLDMLTSGQIDMANGDNWISGTLAAIMLQNYLDGTPLKDSNGKAPIMDTVGFYEVTSQQVALYKKFFVDEQPYSADEIKQMDGKINKDFNYDAFVQVIKNYTLENRMAEKVKEGKVTKDELSAVGIKVQ